MTAADDAMATEWREKGWDVIRDGFPDMLCERDGEIIAVEIKRSGDYLRPNQEACAAFLQKAGIPYFVLGDYKLRGGGRFRHLRPINALAKRRDGWIDGLAVDTDERTAREHDRLEDALTGLFTFDKAAA